MPDADSTLEILIKMVADTTGYTMTQTEAAKLQTVIKETNEVSVRANKEDLEGTRKLLGSKFELRHIVAGLAGQDVPQLAWALSSLAYGGAGLASIFLLVGGFQALREHIKSAEKATSDFMAAAAKGDAAAGAQAVADATRDAASEEEDYLTSLQEILRGQQGVTTELENQLQLTAAIQAAKQSAMDADRTLALAKISQEQALGHITESEAITEKAQVEKQYLQDKARMEEELFQRQQKQRQSAIDEAARDKPGLEKARNEAKGALDNAKEKQAWASHGPSVEDVRKAQAEAEDANLEEKKRRLHDPTYAEIQKGDKQRAVNEAETKVARAKLLDEMYLKARQADSVDLKKLEDDLAAKEKAAKDNATALAKAQDEMANANRVHSNPEVGRDKQETEAASEETVDTNMRAQLFKHAQEIERRMHEGHSGGLSTQDAKELLDYLKIVSQMPGAVKEGMLNALGGFVTKEELQREIDNLRTLATRPSS
jgi:hypothetical protein